MKDCIYCPEAGDQQQSSQQSQDLVTELHEWLPAKCSASRRLEAERQFTIKSLLW